MKKFYLTMLALVALATTVNAGVKNLFKQDFESTTSPANAGWTSPNLAGNMSIFSDEEGSAFQFELGNNNNRNAVLNFNYGLENDKTIFDGQDVKKYTIKFVWGLIANSNTQGNPGNNKNLQFSSELAVVTPSIATSDVEGWKITTVINNGQYAANDSLRLFALTQLKGAYSEADGASTTPYWADANDINSYALDFYINGDKNKVVTLMEGGWYEITINVDTEARTTSYEIFSLNDNDVVTNGSGTSTIPEYASVWAKGLNVLLGRYYSIAQIDDVKVQTQTEGDFANKPTIAMTGIDMAKRSYKIFFEDGEILHVKKTEGDEITTVDSPYEYTTETSGTLEVWTESGTYTSEHVTMDVVAEAIELPKAAIDIKKVKAGYVKTLQLSVNNTEVPTQPTITLTYEYSNGDKSATEVPSPYTYEVTEKGTLTVTTHAYGFVPSVTTFENNTEFAVDAAIDFQHMDEATLTGKGFAEIDPLQSAEMKGENNWTARKRLWFGIENGEVDADGKAKYDTYVVYGPEGASEGVEAIRRFYLKPSTLTETVSKTIFAPFYTWYTGQADPAVADGSDVAGLKVNYGIGLINTGTKTDDGASINYANGIVGVNGLTDNDYYMLYIVNDYGTSSKHPIYPQGTTVADGKAQYKADNIGDGTNVQVLRGTETFSLYRIDTAISRVEIYKATNGTGIETINYNKIVSDQNAPIYNLNGIQMNPNALQKGVYIKQGKKFVVR